MDSGPAGVGEQQGDGEQQAWLRAQPRSAQASEPAGTSCSARLHNLTCKGSATARATKQACKLAAHPWRRRLAQWCGSWLPQSAAARNAVSRVQACMRQCLWLALQLYWACTSAGQPHRQMAPHQASMLSVLCMCRRPAAPHGRRQMHSMPWCQPPGQQHQRPQTQHCSQRSFLRGGMQLWSLLTMLTTRGRKWSQRRVGKRLQPPNWRQGS